MYAYLMNVIGWLAVESISTSAISISIVDTPGLSSVWPIFVH